MPSQSTRKPNASLKEKNTTTVKRSTQTKRIVIHASVPRALTIQPSARIHIVNELIVVFRCTTMTKFNKAAPPFTMAKPLAVQSTGFAVR